MAVRYRSEFKSDKLIDWKIDIHDSDFSGDVILFKVKSNGFELSHQGENQDIINPILASEVKFTFEVESEEQEALITDLAGAPESRFTVVIYREEEFYWAGAILTDIATVQNFPFPYGFTVVAIDGLSTLKDIPYSFPIGTPYPGHDNLIDIVGRCLKKIPHIAEHYAAADPFLVTAINWYATGHTYDATGDPLFNTFVDNRAFHTSNEFGEYTFKNCWEVLRSVLATFGARILHAEGFFFIDQIETRAFYDVEGYARKYAYDLNTPAAYTLAFELNLGVGYPRNILRGAQTEFFPALKKVTTEIQVNARRNLIEGIQFDQDNTFGNFGHVYGGGHGSALYFSGKLEFSFTTSGPLFTPPGPVCFFVFGIRIGFGGLYLNRPITVQNSTVTYGPLEWNASTGSYYRIHSQMWPVPYSSATNPYDGVIEWNFYHKLPTGFDGGNLDVQFIPLILYRDNGTTISSNGGLNWDAEFITKDLKLTVNYLRGQYPERAVYTATNAISGNTAEIKIETLLGDSHPEVLNQFGSLRLQDGSDYPPTEEWGPRSLARDKPLLELLAQQVLLLQDTPRERLAGRIYGLNLQQVQSPLFTDGKRYLLLGGTYYANVDEYEGQWAELHLPTEPDPPVLDEATEPGVYELVAGAHPGQLSDTGNTAVNFTGQAAAALYPITVSTTAESLIAGAITSLELVDALGENAFLAGDTLIVVNPANAESVNLLVMSDTAEGDTIVDVSGTIPTDFPEHSFVIYSPANWLRAGKVVKLPDGTLDQTLRHNGTKWVASSALQNDGTNSRVTGSFRVDGPVSLNGSAGSSGQYMASTGAATVPAWQSPATLSSANTAISVSGGSGATFTTATLTFNPGNVLLSTLGGSLGLAQIAQGGASTGNFLAWNGTSWAPATGGGGLGSGDFQNALGLNGSSSKIEWGETALIKNTTIAQATFSVTWSNGQTRFNRGSNSPTNLATVDIDGKAVQPASTATPVEDAILNIHGYTGTNTQIDSQLSVGAHTTATNGIWIQGRSLTSYTTYRPIYLQPRGGKVVFGYPSGTDWSGMFTIVGRTLTGSTLTSAALHVAAVEGDGNAKIALGNGNNYFAGLWTDSTGVNYRLSNLSTNTSATVRIAIGGESVDKFIFKADGKLGVNFTSLTGLHSTLTSNGSLAGVALDTLGAATIDHTKFSVCYTGTSNVAWTLDAASTCNGRVHVLMNHSSNGSIVTLTQTIREAAGTTFNQLNPGDCVLCVAHLSQWRGKRI
jgi:hypothetical protein